jgi:cellobiose transport system substrate-binding protein
LRNDITPASWSEGLTPEGRLIGMPLSTSPGSLWYRMDLLDAAGIPSDPAILRERVKSWDDLFGLAQELKRATPKVSLLIDPLLDVFSPMVAQQGNNLIDGNQVLIVEKCTLPAIKAAEVRMLKLDADLGGNLFDGVGTEAMLAGKLAGMAAATWFQGFINERFFNTIGKWRVIPPPGGPYSRFTQFLVIPEQSQKKELAWQFVQYCCATVEGQNTFLKTSGDFPVYMPAWKDDLYDQAVPLFGDQAVYRLWADVAMAAPPGKSSPHDRAIDDLVFPKIRDVVALGNPPAQAMQDAEAAVIAAFPGLQA